MELVFKVGTIKLAFKIFTLNLILSGVTLKLVFKFQVIVVQISVKSAVMVRDTVVLSNKFPAFAVGASQRVLPSDTIYAGSFIFTLGFLYIIF